MRNKYELTTCGNYAKLFFSKEKENFYTLIDISTLVKLQELGKSWHVTKSSETRYYVQAFVNGVKVRLHRFLIDCPKGKMVDHINHNSFDNRIENLRIVTRSENLVNKGKLRSDNTTGVTGVYFDKRINKYVGRIWDKGKCKCIGYFDTIEKANEAMIDARQQYYGGYGNGIL